MVVNDKQRPPKRSKRASDIDSGTDDVEIVDDPNAAGRGYSKASKAFFSCLSGGDGHDGPANPNRVQTFHERLRATVLGTKHIQSDKI